MAAKVVRLKKIVKEIKHGAFRIEEHPDGSVDVFQPVARPHKLLENEVLPIVWRDLMGFLDISFLQKEREKLAVFPRYLLSEFCRGLLYTAAGG